MYLRENAQGVSSGNCLDGWVDASFVVMGCLHFNSTSPLGTSLTQVEDYVWPDNYPDSRDTENCMMLDFSGMTGAYNVKCDYTYAYPICQLK